MKNEEKSRRAFLKGAAAGAGAGAVTALAPPAIAQTSDVADTTTEPLPAGIRHGAFFNHEQAAAVAAFAERLMPGEEGKPGATEADVLNYIDLALAGAYADLQDVYRHGLVALDDYCLSTYDAPFASLDSAQQDATITSLEADSVTDFEWPDARAFFETLRSHTMEGMFADPVYGGNKDFAGWHLVGFPGAQFAYTPAEVRSTEPFDRAPILGLQSQSTRRE
ncbi:MAG: gluconate 2-dehydrogenase subunit 3 family protein [Gammaproteobacteria bacterium]